MNITQFIQYLNKSKNWHIEGGYYAKIDEWRAWWRGDYAEFHDVREVGLDGAMHKRPMYRLRMPKQACEDWAALLLGDATTVTVGDPAAARWLLGDDQQQTGGALGAMQFWAQANRAVELAMRSGTAAFVLGCEGLNTENGNAITSPAATLTLDVLPAECILPITIRHGKVIDVAFASECVVGGKSCIYLQTHCLGQNGYTITNEYFTSEAEDTERADYKPAPLPAGVAARFCTGSELPWFALMRPNVLKNRLGGSGLGMAVFAEALDAAKLCDLAFDNYARDIHLGGKKVFYNKNLLRSWVDSKTGEQHFAAPDDIRQQLFFHAPGTDPDAEPDWHEYNPDLRVADNSRAVQDALDYFSFKVGLGTRHYQFSGGSVKTATEYTGDRQDMVQHANRHQIEIEAALLQFLRTVLWAGHTLLGQNFDAACPLTLNFDDSYIIDTGTRREIDRQDVRDGLWPRYRYLMEWRGLSEADARAIVAEADAEGSADALPLA